MKIFVGYGYNERDQWVERLVFPIIEAFGSEVVSGKEIFGERITEAIRGLIRDSDALVAFLTRRDRQGDEWSTHRWVSDELATALAVPILALEVREVGVTDQGGIAGDLQRITYDETSRDECLVQLVQAIGRWHRMRPLDRNLQLLPEAFVDQIRPVLRRPDLNCTYRVLDTRGEETPDIQSSITPITGGLFVRLRNVPRQALVQVHIEVQERSWTSDFEPVEQSRIYLREDTQDGD